MVMDYTQGYMRWLGPEMDAWSSWIMVGAEGAQTPGPWGASAGWMLRAEK